MCLCECLCVCVWTFCVPCCGSMRAAPLIGLQQHPESQLEGKVEEKWDLVLDLDRCETEERKSLLAIKVLAAVVHRPTTTK